MSTEEILALLLNPDIRFEDIPLDELPPEELVHLIGVLRGNRFMLFGLVDELKENIKTKCHTVYFSPVTRPGVH